MVTMNAKEVSTLAVIALEEVGIDKDGTSNQEALLRRGSTLGEGNVECVGVGKNFNGQGFRLLENLANVGCISVSLSLVSWKDAKGHLAATLSTARISFGEAVDAATTAAGRGVNLVKLSSARIVNRKHGDAEEAILLHSSEFLSSRSDRGKLVAAALAGAEWTGAGAINCKHLRVCVQLPMKIRH